MQPFALTAKEFTPLIPELFLVAMGMFLLISGVFRGNAFSSALTRAAILVALAAACMVMLLPAMGIEKTTVLNGMFILDRFAVFIKVLILIAVALALCISLEYRVEPRFFEFPILMLFAAVGMMVMVSANDLLALYMGLELQSLALYVLAAMQRDSERSSEAGLKYFVLGALSSGILLYGCSMIYGFTGATNFAAIAAAIEGPVSPGVILGMVMVIAGLCFKLSAAPFHMWTPDVYEGAPTPVTAFFAAAPKVAALALFVRFLAQPFGDAVPAWQQVVILISILSMVVGAFAALRQSNIKRLLAYSSIGHVGYALVGIASGSIAGIHATLVYIAIYMPMSIGAFACVLLMRRRNEMLENLSDLAGIAKSRPVFSFVLAVFMLSMAGIPPLAGFFGKFFVFTAAVQRELYALSVIGVLSSVVAAYYYLKIVKIMYFDSAEHPLKPEEMLPATRAVLAATALFNVLFFMMPSPLFKAAEAAAKSLFL